MLIAQIQKAPLRRGFSLRLGIIVEVSVFSVIA